MIAFAFGEEITPPGAVVASETLTPEATPTGQRVAAPEHADGLLVFFLGAAHAGVGIGALPNAGMLFDIEAGARLGIVELRAGVDVALAVDQFLDAAATEGGRFDRLAFASRLLVNVVDAPLSLAPYAGVQLGRIRGRGLGISNPQTAQAAWNALVAGVRCAVGIRGWLFAEVDARVELPFARYQFEISGLGAIYTPSQAALALTLGLSARFP